MAGGNFPVTKNSMLPTVSVVTQPHCQLHPPPLPMTPHVSVRNYKYATVKLLKVEGGEEGGL